MDINKLNFTTKITDSGATVNGRLSSDEFNLIPIKIDELVDDANTKTTNISDIETTANDAKDLATNAIDNFTKPKIESIFTGEISSHTHDNRYQQLESGKGLSANNFTDALLDKLNNLSNYEDTSLIERVVVIETWKTALTGTSTDEIINTFTEIVNFLSGITGTDSLTKVLSDMQTAIVNQIPTNNNQLTNGAEYQTQENVSSLITTALNNYLKTSDLADWVKTSEKPSYTQSEITDNVGIVVIKDLASTPTTTTLDDGNGYTFKVGDMIRVENSLSASGYYFYMLNKVVDSIATWKIVEESDDAKIAYETANEALTKVTDFESNLQESISAANEAAEKANVAATLAVTATNLAVFGIDEEGMLYMERPDDDNQIQFGIDEDGLFYVDIINN